MLLRVDNETPAPATGEQILGHVLSCRGSEARIGLPVPAPVNGERATVGKFIAIKAGASVLVGMIAEVTTAEPGPNAIHDYRSIARVDLMGEIVRGQLGTRFQRGVRNYPAIGEEVELLRKEELRLIHSAVGSRSINVGQLHQDSSVPAYVDVDGLLTKHFAILGSTGVGKSSGVAVILTEVLRSRPDVRILLLDVHNEYSRCFGPDAAVIGGSELKLPFWLFNFEEMTDVIYGGKPSAPEEVEILAELIPVAKSMYSAYKTSGERPGLTRRTPQAAGFSPDTPTPYMMQDLLTLIDQRMGKLENRASRMSHHRLMMRLEGLLNDPRYAFMFENANVGGDTMAAVLSQLFRLDSDRSRITVLKLASLPGEAVDAVVCVAARLAFEFGLWSDGSMPLLLACEEAHRYAAADHSVGFAPARRALSRIAKEGRKYGVYLGLVTQRPAELDPTIISQCSTLFMMRMANDEDQSLLRSAVSDAAANLLSFVPSLGTGEVVAIGEGMPLPTRFSFRGLPRALVPAGETGIGSPEAKDEASRGELVRRAIERWRRATMSQAKPQDIDAQAPEPAPGARREELSTVTRGLSSLAADRPLPTRAPLLQERNPAARG